MENAKPRRLVAQNRIFELQKAVKKTAVMTILKYYKSKKTCRSNSKLPEEKKSDGEKSS